MQRISRGVIAAAMLWAAVASGESRYEVRYSRTLEYAGGKINVDHAFGELRILGSSDSEVNVVANIRSSDPEFGKRIRIVVEQTSAGVAIRTEYPEGDRQRSGTKSFSVDVRVTVPEKASVSARSRFGNIDVSDLRGTGDYTNAYGSLRLHELGGMQTGRNQFGSIEATSIHGSVVVANTNGSIRVAKVDGNIDVTNRFGSVEVSSVENAVIRNSNGSMQIADVGGNLIVENAFANTSISSVNGSLSVTSKNGPLEVHDVNGTTTVNHSFGDLVVGSVKGALTVAGQNLNVEASDIQGAIAITSSHGTVKLASIGGGIVVRSSFGPVFVNDVSAGVDIQNEFGSIQVSDLDGRRCQPIVLRTTNASIRLRVASNSNYDLNAVSSNGAIRASIPMTMSTQTGEQLKGRLGRGGCRMDLSNAFGSITIESD